MQRSDYALQLIYFYHRNLFLEHQLLVLFLHSFDNTCLNFYVSYLGIIKLNMINRKVNYELPVVQFVIKNDLKIKEIFFFDIELA